MMRKFLYGFALTALLASALAFVTGSVALVETHGNSMAPRISAGDLVLVREGDYGVGDVVAYSSADLRRVVLHRVVSIEDDRYTFRGDHNDFDDPEQPSGSQLLGKELLHIPHGGIWLNRLTSPTALGLIAFGLLAGGGTAVQSRRRRRRSTMSQHTAPTPRASLAGLPPRMRTAMVVAGVTAAAGLVLAAVSWTKPVRAIGTTEQGAATMTFAYRAKVPPSPAYEDTTVTSPAPVFRRLADAVDVEYSYQGRPGSVAVTAELAAASGWRAELPLQPAVRFAGSRHTGTVHLDLDALEARSQAAADVIGIPASQVDVTVVATVTTHDGESFAAELDLALTPLQLTVPGGTAALTVQDSNPTEVLGSSDNSVSVAGKSISVSTLRLASGVLTLGGLLALCIVVLASRRTSSDQGAAIRRRYAAILLQVEPVTSPSGRPVVDVVDFDALAKLAERYGLLVLHWTRSGVESFIVQDDGVTYRYRTGAAGAPVTPLTDQQQVPETAPST